MLIDTHCHINMMFRGYKSQKKFQPLSATELDLCKTIVNDAEQQEVTTIINVGTNLIDSLTCIDIAKHFKNCYATLGLHPNDTNHEWKTTIIDFTKLLEEKNKLKIVGIGECGIDKHYPKYDLKQQQHAFHAQIELALEHNLALSIHSRDADEETYEALAKYQKEPNFRGVIHCFSSDRDYAQKYIDLGFVLGFGGTVTYPKNEELRHIAKTFPLEKIILETDAPFLAPQAIRGKQNSPAQIRIIAEFIAELRNNSYKQICDTTSKTAHDLFGII